MKPSVLQLGVSLLQLLLVSPRDGISMCKWVVDQFEVSSKPPFRVRDLLPLPLTPVGAVLKLLGRMEATQSGLLMASTLASDARKKKGRQQLGKLIREGSRQLWRLIAVMALNGMSDGWVFTSIKIN